MNNVIRLKPRQRVKYRRWAYLASAGTTAGACGYWALVALWPAVFQHLLAGLLSVGLVLLANSILAAFVGQKVRLERAEKRRQQEWRASERARARAAMKAPTQALRILQPPPLVSQTTYRPDGAGLDDRMRMRLWDDLTERTGDITSPRPTPPHGWRTGAA